MLTREEQPPVASTGRAPLDKLSSQQQSALNEAIKDSPSASSGSCDSIFLGDQPLSVQATSEQLQRELLYAAVPVERTAANVMSVLCGADLSCSGVPVAPSRPAARQLFGSSGARSSDVEAWLTSIERSQVNIAVWDQLLTA